MNWINVLRQFLFGDYQVWIFGLIFGILLCGLGCLIFSRKRLPFVLKLVLFIIVVILILFCMRQVHFMWESFEVWSTTPLGPPLQLTPKNIVECPGGICPGDPNPFLDTH